MTINFENLTSPLDPDSPSGPDLDDEYDQAYHEFVRLVQSEEWSEAKELGLELHERTRDLRLGVNFAHVLLALDGLAGFADGIECVRRCVEELWESVHPQLDGELPPRRTNDLMSLGVVAGSQSANPIHDRLRRTPFVSTRSVGSFSYRDFLIASGELAAAANEEDEGKEVPTISLINAAVQEADREELAETAAALARIVADTEAITEKFRQEVGADSAPDLTSLSALATGIRQILADMGAIDEADTQESAPVEAGSSAPPAPVPGQINSRQDAVRALEKVGEYFEKNEPSSPVSLLINRAKRLISMNFMDVLRDLSPDSLQ